MTLVRLRGRRAVVTGAARGIGAAIASHLMREGARVAVLDVDGQAAQSKAHALGGDAIAVAVDVSDAASVAAAFAAVDAAWGGVDLLVNNAGVQLNRASVELTASDWRHVLGVDLDGAFFCSQEAARRMMASGRGGCVVSIASVAMSFGWPRRMPYAVAKAGLAALTRSLAVEWASAGIRVNAVAPGYVLTDLVRHAFTQGHIQEVEITSKIALGRLAEVDEIAPAVVFLASDEARYITGHILAVDGGFSVLK